MRVLVCVTNQRSCERLIRFGAEKAKQLDAQLSVIHVAGLKAPLLGLENGDEAIQYLFNIAREQEAEMTILRSDNFLHALVEHAQKEDVAAIVLGATPPHAKRDVPRELELLLPDITMHVLPYLSGEAQESNSTQTTEKSAKRGAGKKERKARR